MSPYELHKATNAALAEAGIAKKLPPQMFYNYTSGRLNAGKTPFIPCTVVAGKVHITEAAAAEWLATYVRKQIALTY